MSSFLITAGVFVLLMVAIGLLRILWGPTDADRMMAAQLFGSGGIAVLLLLSGESAPAMDVALILALLSAFASVAFASRATRTDDE